MVNIIDAENISQEVSDHFAKNSGDITQEIQKKINVQRESVTAKLSDKINKMFSP
jgi:hypothetical protein